MTFFNMQSNIFRQSNKSLFNIFYDDNGLKYEYFDQNNTLVNSGMIYKYKDISFSDFSFCMYNDNIYGTINDNKILLVTMKDNNINIEKLCTYDINNFNIKFPFIKVIDSYTHIIYYVYHVSNPNQCALFHQFKSNGCWNEYKIDFINYHVLNEFIVTWNKNIPTIFYMKLVNGVNQIFCSTFSLTNFKWNTPIQITSSKNNKLYLSVTRDSMNFYNISFCEESDNMYSVKFINGYLLDDKFDIITNSYVSDSSLNMYPSILKENKYDIYLTWVNYNKLCYSMSKDLGKTWSDVEIDVLSLDNNFTRCTFESNLKHDKNYLTSKLFTVKDEIGFIGF